MRRVRRVLSYAVVFLVVIVAIWLFRPTWTPEIKGENSISTLEQLNINGAKHSLMIRGEDSHNPIILFVHGGPGCSEIPYVTKYQDLLEEHFTIVHYDQRGSGKSYEFFKDYSDLSADVLVEDLISITDYICDRFGQDTVLLAGHSFGTTIGIKAVSRVPEKYKAYIGIGQVSDTEASELDSLNYCLDEAKKANSTEDIEKLEAIQVKAKEENILVPRSLVRKYGGAARLIDDNADYTEGFLTHPEYNGLDFIRYNLGIKQTQDLLLEELFENPLPNRVTQLQAPCYFVMGKYDYMTSTKAAKQYFDELEAEEKEFIVFDQSAHYPQFEEKEKFADWMIRTFVD